MIKYILRRLIQAIPTFFGITLFSYFLLWLAPGNVVDRLYFAPNISSETRERLAAQLGINDPFHTQYLRWLIGDDWMRWDNDGDGISDQAFELMTPLDANGDGIPEAPGENLGILRGDFGRSFIKKKPVLDVILDNLPATLELGIAAILTSMVIGIPVGVISAATQGRLFDNVARVMAVVFDAIPAFWLGLILLLLFGSRWGILPLGGRCVPNLYGVCPPVFQRIEYLILPHCCLCGDLHRPILPLRTYVNAGGHESGLHPYGTRQRHVEPRGLLQACHAQCHGTGGYFDWTHHHQYMGWRHRDRNRLCLARRRPRRLFRGAAAGLSGCHGSHNFCGARDHSWFLAFRYSLCPHRSAHSPVLGTTDEQQDQAP